MGGFSFEHSYQQPDDSKDNHRDASMSLKLGIMLRVSNKESITAFLVPFRASNLPSLISYINLESDGDIDLDLEVTSSKWGTLIRYARACWYTLE